MSKDEINAFLGAGTVYEGKLTFQGAVRIDGAFTGEIVSDGALIIGKDAVVEGTARVGEMLLSGKSAIGPRCTLSPNERMPPFSQWYTSLRHFGNVASKCFAVTCQAPSASILINSLLNASMSWS